METAGRRIRLLIAAVAISSALGTQPLLAMTVQPVVIDLATAGRSMSDVIIVENTFDRPLAVEVSSQALQLTEDGVEASGVDTGELAVFPPQASIQPGQRQNFRVQYVGEPDLPRSKHYFVTVAQLPVQEVSNESNIQLLYNFQVLVSVAPDSARPNISIASAEIGRDESGNPVPVIHASNSSAVHGYLSRGRIRVTQRDSSGQEVFRRDLTGPEIQQSLGYGLIGGGQNRHIALPVSLPSTEGTVTVSYSAD